MIDSFRNIFAIPDLRKRVFFTFALLAVYRLGAFIPIPGIDPVAIAEFTKAAEGTVLGFLNLFSGGALGRMTVFALGIMPYISSSIILQLLTVVWPYLEKLSKEGELGRRKITQYTRYGTIILSVIQGMGISFFLERTAAPGGAPLVPEHFQGWGFRLLTVLTLTTGTIFIMWLGEQISERGIGNGISLIIFAGIVVGLVPRRRQHPGRTANRDMSPLKLIFILAIIMVVAAFICYVEMGQRRIPITYAKRIQGRKMMGGQSTFLPLKVNTGGVIPIIFASSVITFPATILAVHQAPHSPENHGAAKLGHAFVRPAVLSLSIIFFTYFYISIIFNPQDVSDNLKKYGGFIPGIRAGKNTADYIDSVPSKLTFIGAIYLALVALLPEFLMTGFKVGALPFVGDFLEANPPALVLRGF